jgi:hypothetical protein
MLPPTTTHAAIAQPMSRRRPKRIAASLPMTLATAPTRPSAVTTTAGDNCGPWAPIATKARNATAQPRNALISSVCTQ